MVGWKIILPCWVQTLGEKQQFKLSCLKLCSLPTGSPIPQQTVEQIQPFSRDFHNISLSTSTLHETCLVNDEISTFPRTLQKKSLQPHRIHVWHIYLYIWLICMVNVGKYTIVPWILWVTTRSLFIRCVRLPPFFGWPLNQAPRVIAPCRCQ